jgi:hypothetical protein
MSSHSKSTPPPKPTTLRSLQRYASRQTELIESLLNPAYPNSHFRDSTGQDWVSFWLSTWGNQDPDSLGTRQKVERDSNSKATGKDNSDDEDDDEDYDEVPLECDVMIKPEAVDNCWHFICEKFFVRSEFKEAEEFILSTCGIPMAPSILVVAGQVGIGLNLSPRPLPGHNIFHQENPPFSFESSCAVSHSHFPPHSRSSPIASCFFIKGV